jgi:hypothetical protein
MIPEPFIPDLSPLPSIPAAGSITTLLIILTPCMLIQRRVLYTITSAPDQIRTIWILAWFQ